MLDRREMLKRAGMAALATGLGSARAFALDNSVMLPFDNGKRPLVKYPQKRPMIGLTSRPPQLETPFSVFNDGPITPNNAFFVRYHLADIPYNIDPDKFTLEIKGKVDRPLKLSLKEIRKLPAVELVAVNQCSGNSRGFFEPRVAGGQLGNGAMGNARWRGVPLKTVLDMAGVQAGRKAGHLQRNGQTGHGHDAGFRQGARYRPCARRRGDAGLWHERRGFAVSQRLSAAPGRARLLRHLLGQAPQRNHRDRQCIRRLLDEDRLPDSGHACNCVEPGTAPKATIPINRFTVRSFITNVTDDAKVKARKTTRLKGIAFDGGKGIKEVAVSIDGGKTWTPAKLGKDLGKYSFREWTLPVKLAAGIYELKVRATNNAGDTQPGEPRWNPAGYLRNVIETVRVTAA